MKKVSLIFATIILICIMPLGIGCSNSIQDPPKETFIELSADNCNYYLSIENIFKDSIHAGGQWFYSYDLYIYGAVDGLYINCSAIVEINGSKRTVTLNAAGYAQIHTNGRATLISASGQIKI